jgi:maltooligosyltrehalose synthase
MKINTVLLNARNSELTQTIKNALYLENLQVEGRTSNDVINEAKKVLSLQNNDSLLASYESKAASLNRKTNLLIKIMSAKDDAKVLGLTGSLEEILNSLTNDIKVAYDVTDEDLFLEE